MYPVHFSIVQHEMTNYFYGAMRIVVVYIKIRRSYVEYTIQVNKFLPFSSIKMLQIHFFFKIFLILIISKSFIVSYYLLLNYHTYSLRYGQNIKNKGNKIVEALFLTFFIIFFNFFPQLNIESASPSTTFSCENYLGIFLCN